MIKAKPTRRQLQIFVWIQEYIKREGYPPTRQEIANSFGFRSANAAQDHLMALERKGWLEVHCNVARGIRLILS